VRGLISPTLSLVGWLFSHSVIYGLVEKRGVSFGRFWRATKISELADDFTVGALRVIRRPHSCIWV
jgi:hypothetical protein